MNNRQEFKKGDIFWTDFQPEGPTDKPSFLIKGRHMAVVLLDSTYRNNTVVVAPISSLHNPDGTMKNITRYDLPILREDNPFLRNDSYIKLSQITSKTRDRMEPELAGSLDPSDTLSLDMNMIRFLDLRGAIDALVQERLNQIIRTQSRTQQGPER